MSYLIWWTSQSDAEKAENSDELNECKKYIVSEFTSRLGRGGRGRLWVHSSISSYGKMNYNDHHPNAHYCDEAGGIVFNEHDLESVSKLPGLITDMDMNTIYDNRTVIEPEFVIPVRKMASELITESAGDSSRLEALIHAELQMEHWRTRIQMCELFGHYGAYKTAAMDRIKLIQEELSNIGSVHDANI